MPCASLKKRSITSKHWFPWTLRMLKYAQTKINFLNSNGKTSGNLIRLQIHVLLSEHNLNGHFYMIIPRNQLRFFPNMWGAHNIFHTCTEIRHVNDIFHCFRGSFSYQPAAAWCRQVLEPKASMVRRITPKLLGSSTSALGGWGFWTKMKVDWGSNIYIYT